MTDKNDQNDAAGIAEAATSIDQQDVLLLHHARELLIKQRTAQFNQIRGLLIEFGIVIPKGIRNINK